MFTAAFVAAVAAVTVANAAPVARASVSIPSTYAEGYLEPYAVYHTRYLALDCEDKHDTTFFDDCCHPMLATQNLKDDRKAYCTPSAAAYTSAASVAAATTTVAGDDAGSAFASATSSAAASSSSAAAAEVTQNNNYAQPQASTEEASTSSAAPAPAQTSASSGGSGDYSGGFATYFYQGGNAGACGNVHSDYDKIVAIDIEKYGNTGDVSGTCGKWLTITNTNNGQSVVAMVADVCPTCANGNSLDLSVGAFEAIASLSDGEVPITWSYN